MKDPIDTAIDQVATRMVQVREDEDLALRIAAALPERSSRFGWLIPQFAVITAFAIAAVVWTTRETPTPSVAVFRSGRDWQVCLIRLLPSHPEPLSEQCPWNFWNPWNRWNPWRVTTSGPCPRWR